jgi:hypothetical protein
MKRQIDRFHGNVDHGLDSCYRGQGRGDERSGLTQVAVGPFQTVVGLLKGPLGYPACVGAGKLSLVFIQLE